MSGPHIPDATYRLQLNAGFTFDDAAALLPYLKALGFSHCYLSPYLKARAGSPHGYDIVDHTAIDPELGGDAGLERLVAALAEHGMGQVLDLVTNHMGVGGNDNGWWLSVLEHGPASPYAEYFDIDWHPVKEALRGKVLCPFLGDHYGSVLESGDLELAFDAEPGEFRVHYYEHRFPLAPETYPGVLEDGLEVLSARLGPDDPDLRELESIITALNHLPERGVTAPERVEERLREAEVQKGRLATLCGRCPPVREHVAAAVRRFNGDPEDRHSFDKLHQLLEAQPYRLAYWRVASDEINYRRFFDINELAGLRMEAPHVFHATHERVRELVASGRVDGLRLDHPDGLHDPLAYLRRLRRTLRWTTPAEARTGTGLPAYTVVEKILAGYEHLPEDWPVHGTTGYDFSFVTGGLFVDPESEEALNKLYTRFTGRTVDFEAVLYERKRFTIQAQLSSDLTVLANLLDRIAQLNRGTRDFTLNGLRDALTEVVACFPVYRTYIRPGRVADSDVRYVEWAVAQAKKKRAATDPDILDFIRDLLLQRRTEAMRPFDRRLALRFTMKFQQYTAPVMAKSLEDTTFYVYNRLVSLNEVGGEPRRFGVSVSAFHHANQDRGRRWPHAMLATSTHDAKRGEDVRARIHVLSEMPRAWREHVYRWRRLNANKKGTADGEPAPSPNDEYLLYQTLLGAWPLEELDDAGLAGFRERIRAYLLKAVREAKLHTSWVHPNEEYEEAVSGFVDRVLAMPNRNPFLTDFVPFQRQVARFGALNGLAQTLLRLTAPGVPDTYQGSELWDLNLVDPDNRRPVDYGRRRALLDSLQQQNPAPRDLLAGFEDGRVKLDCIRRSLGLRRAHPALFRDGDYLPLDCHGDKADHLCAFARCHAGQWAVIVVGRWFARLTAGAAPIPMDPVHWGDTWLELPEEAPAVLTDVLTDRPLEVDRRDGRPALPARSLLTELPGALLTASPD